MHGSAVTVEHDDRESRVGVREARLAPLRHSERVSGGARVVVRRETPLVAAEIAPIGGQERYIEALDPTNASLQPLEGSACRHEFPLPSRIPNRDSTRVARRGW